MFLSVRSTFVTGLFACFGCFASAQYTYTTIDAPGAAPDQLIGGAYGGTYPIAINNAGEVVGFYVDSTNGHHGFTYSNWTFATVEYTGCVGGTELWAINNYGEILGTCGYQGFLYANGKFTALSIPNMPQFGSYGLNDAGQIVGVGYNRTTAAWGGYLDSNGSITALNIYSPLAINNAGQIVGYYDNSGTFTGAIYSAGTYSSIANSQTISGINNLGQMIGTYSTGGSFLYSNGTITSLVDPVAPQGGVATFGNGINDSGTIVGSYWDPNYGYHGFIAEPTVVATPVFSPAGGTYSSTQTVTISDFTPGATIYYTTNGNTPTTASTRYTSPISVSTTRTIKAIATATGYLQSAVATATYTINRTAATPVFSPAAGTYPSTQSVIITDSTSGATIYYTTNGSTPTTSSTKYSGAISVASSETIKAIATASGYSQSAVGSATYTIANTAAAPVFSPAAGTYSSTQSVTITDATPGATIYYTTNGSTPTTSSTRYSGAAISVSTTETIKAIATATGYTQSAVASAAYTITKTAATPVISPAAGTYSSTQSVTITDSTSGATIYYTTNGSTPTTSSTRYSGAAISVSTTETIKAIATATGYTQSAVASAAYTIQLTPTVYNVATSFEAGYAAKTNPNGVWSYGYSAGFTSPITLYDVTAQNGVNGPNAQYWLSSTVNVGTSPAAEYNNGPAYDDGNVDFLANDFVLVAGVGGQYSDAVFTAPVTGSYTVAATYRGDQYGIGTVVAVVLNGAMLFNGSVTAEAQLVPFNTTLTLNAGDTLVFSVGPSGGTQNTGLALTITGP